MVIFLESILIWVGLALVVGVVGFSMFQQNQQIRTFVITAVLVVVLLVVGILLYNFVDTDRKSVARSLNKIISAIEKDDLDLVLQFIDEKAESPRSLARSNMSLIRVPQASFSGLDVKVNYLTNPPIASVTFIAMINWMPKSGWLKNEFPADKPIPERVEFDIEMRKTNNGDWKVTNKCDFQHRGLR
ncbi:MAG: hypothetical protein LBT09_06670 [Planctomycetaceae bacterium]|jgi:hypothetical protein|nr:hypothetical protein [Planctomycetaceae bacterium]